MRASNNKRETIRRSVQLESECAQLWKQACELDNIPAGSKFAEFSAGNPYAEQYNNKVGQLQALRASVFTYRKRGQRN